MDMMNSSENDGYDTDNILSQALDLFENREPKLETDKPDDDESIFITQNTFRVKGEGEEENELDVLETIDLMEMCVDGGPYIIAATRPQPKTEVGVSAVDRFKPILHTEDVVAKQEKFVPKNTVKSNSWAVNLFSKWTDFILNENNTNDVSNTNDVQQILLQKDLKSMCDDEINLVLSYFFMSIKKENGEEYKNESIYSIACAIQRYLQSIGRKINIFMDSNFEKLRNVIDNVMIEKCKMGISNVKKSAKTITIEQEENLWLNGLLGTDAPRKLLNTLFWVLGVNFGLRGGEEHRNLTFDNFAVSTDTENRTYLCYTETTSKTYKGGLKHKHIEPHTARAYENSDQPERCPVKIYRSYLEKLPDSIPQNAFYLRPVAKPVANKPWFTSQPVGHNTLKSIVRDIMSQAGFDGYYTNHSLRVTTATRLFNSGAPEQVIREQTGHRSNAIFAYKRTSDNQKATVSRTIQGSNNNSPEMKRQYIPPPAATETSSSTSGNSELLPVSISNCSNVTIITDINILPASQFSHRVFI